MEKQIKKRVEWWPYAIITVFVLFGASVITAVVIAFGQDMSLVTEDYYDQEIAYQDQINKEILTQELNKYLAIKVKGNTLHISYPVELANLSKVSGTLKLFRPATAEDDLSVEVKPDAAGNQTIDLTGKPRGFYRLKADWREAGLTFTDDQEIML